MRSATEHGSVAVFGGPIRFSGPRVGGGSFGPSNPDSGYTAATTAGTKRASGVRHRGFGGGDKGGNSSSPASATRDDTVTSGTNPVAGGYLSKIREADCSREETKVSLSLSPSRYSPPPSKRLHRGEGSISPTRTRSGRSSPASLSPGQFSDQSEDEEEDQLADQVEEVFDPCGVPPVEAWSELDRELLGTASDRPAEPVAPLAVPTPPPTASTSTAPVTSVYTRLGPPKDCSGDHRIPPHPNLTRSWRDSWEAQDFKFSRPLEFVPVFHALAKVLKFSSPPSASPPAEESEFSVFATPTSRSVQAPALWARDQVSKIACTVDDRRVVKEAGSFGDTTLARFFPLVEEDETLLKVLEVEAEVTEYMRSTYKVDWDPAKPFGPKGPHPVTKEAERFAKQVESTSSFLAPHPPPLPPPPPPPPHWPVPCLWRTT